MKWFFLIVLMQICTLSIAQDKLSPALQKLHASRVDFSANQNLIIQTKDLPLLLQQYPNELTLVKAYLKHHVAEISVSLDLLFNTLMEDDNVLFVDIKRTPIEESVLDFPDFRFNRIRKAQNEFPELTGSDLIVAIKEEQFKDDIDIRGKNVSTDLETNGSTSQHATDMATIVAGRGNTHPENLGAVPAAGLASSDYLNLMPDDSEILLAANIHTENHSYGVGIENYYGTEAAAYDTEVYTHPDLVHVFSSGNYGTIIPMSGTYEGLLFANLTGTFKQAKNIITVSAVDTSLQISSYASRGPAFDGRVKPEFCAYGGTGTSDAAAITTGVVSLIQNYHLNVYQKYPEMSLMKAVFMASADDMSTEGPDFYSGYGSVNASKALNTLKEETFRSIAMNTEELYTLDLDIPENTQSIRVAICWIDPAATVNATKALVNDFDSKLLSGSAEWLPWIMNSTPDENLLNAPATRGEDHLNNAELISIKSPPSGTYQLQIKAPQLTTSQTVHIAWQMLSETHYTWDYPTASDVLSTNNEEKIFWNNTLEEPSALWVKSSTTDWQMVSSVTGSDFTWHTPDSSDSYQLKIVSGDYSFTSDVFVVAEKPTLTIGFNCDESFGLQWNKIAGAINYEIYEMGDIDMIKVASTADTTFSISKNASDHVTGNVPEFYAVKPAFGDFTGQPNTAINYRFQGVFCYINFFSAEESDLFPVAIKLSLSTAVHIEQIDILRFVGQEQKLIAEISPNGKTELAFYDPQPSPGLMTYQAILYFENGTVLESDLSEIMIEKSGSAILFPNPAAQETLYILTEGTGQQIQLMDQAGKLILEKVLYYNVESVLIDDFRSGLYLYRLIENKKVIDSGKFIVK